MTPPRGYSVAILGPDGVGKSTLAAGLSDALMDRPVRSVKLSIHSTRWARGPLVLRWSIRTARAVAVLLLARLAVWRGETVLWDRHPLEDRVLAAEGRAVLGGRRGWLTRLAGRPDVLIVLDAPVDVLAVRDPEHDRATLRRLRDRYLRLGRAPHAIILDADRPAERIQLEALTTLERFERTGAVDPRP